MSQEKFYIPQHLDDSPKFLLWDIDLAMSFVLPLFFGLVIGQALIGLVAAIVSCLGWRKIKGIGGKDLIKSLVYWYYPKSVLGLKATPDSSIRNYIG